ncbi:MAG: hypothetical protein AB8G99_14935 [Planctomycetaceae bacterium]
MKRISNLLCAAFLSLGVAVTLSGCAEPDATDSTDTSAAAKDDHGHGEDGDHSHDDDHGDHSEDGK